MSKRNSKWTQELRNVLYSRLRSEFGPYKTWVKAAYPDGQKERFEEVLKELASYFTAHTGHSFEWTALHQQMKWGVTKQGTVKNAGFAYQYILNKAAALDTGFISSGELAGFDHHTLDATEQSGKKFSWEDGDLSDIYVPGDIEDDR